MSGSRGVLSKDPSQRVRRNLPTGSRAILPSEGYTGPIPVWPYEEQSAAELRRWSWVWRTPAAAEFVRMNIEPVVARYVRLSLAADLMISGSGGKASVAQTNLVAEARQLEDKLGLNPSAMLRLNWEIARDELADYRDEVVVERGHRVAAVDEAV